MNTAGSAGKLKRPGSARTNLGRLLFVLGALLGLLSTLFPGTAGAIEDPDIQGDGWGSSWDPEEDWSEHPDEWPHPVANPPLTARCGIDIGIVIDRSGSIADAGQGSNYKASAKALVDAFAGTDSHIGVWSFANEASDTDAGTYPWQQMTDLSVPANADALKTTIDSIPIQSNFSTNWEEGIRAPIVDPTKASPKPDLLIVLTDGQPTIHADNSGSGGSTENQDMAGGILSANLVKQQGIRIFAAGVGGAIEEGLQLISGTTEFDGSNVATADYLVSDWSDLKDALVEFATAVCGGSVEVTKQVSTAQNPNSFAPAAGWDFDGTITNPPPAATVNPANGITGGDGKATFSWASPGTETITVTENQKPGHQLVSVECSLNGQAFAGTPVANGIELNVASGQHVKCTFKNRPVFIDLSVQKDDSVTVASPGQTLVYAITYQNAGDATATATDVTLTETVPANTTFVAAQSSGGWSCPDGSAGGTVCTMNVGSLAPGAGSSKNFAVKVGNPVPANVTQIVNTVTVTGTGAERDLGDQIGTDTDTLDAAPNLMVTKTDNGATVVPGGTISYAIEYANTGDEGAAGVYLSETVPAHTTFVAAGSPGWDCNGGAAGQGDGAAAGATCLFNIGNLAGGTGGSAPFQVRVIDPVPAGVTNVHNSVLIDDSICQTKCDDDDEDTPVTAAPDLEVTKTDNGATVQPGDNLTYAIEYDNTGDEGATGVYLSETVPAHTTFVAAGSPGWDCNGGAAGQGDGAAAGTTCIFNIGNLAGGAGGSAPFQVRVVNPVPAGVTNLHNSVLIDDSVCQTKCDDDDEDTPVTAAPDLEVTKTDNGATVEPGDNLTYTIQYRNVGNQTATGVSLLETLPTHTTFVDDGPGGWSCMTMLGVTTCQLSVGELPVSDTWSEVTITVAVDDPLSEQVDNLHNTVTIDDDICDTKCDDDDEDTPVTASPELWVDKDDNGATGTPGGVIVYDIDYGNSGDEPATSVVLTETVPTHTSFVAASSAAGWDCNGATAGNGDGAAAGATCELALGTLLANASGSTTFGVRVVNPVPAGVDQVVNTVTIGDDEAPNPDDSDTEPTPIDAAPNLTVDKDDEGVTATPGGKISYSIDYANTGDEGATGVVLSETVPANTSFVAADSTAGWSCSPDVSAGSTCTFAVGGLAGGASGSVTFVVQVDSPVPAGVEVIDNTVTIDDDVCRLSCDDDDEDTPVDASPDLTVTKDDGGFVADLGDEVTYAVDYANVGDQGATGVVVTETVPVGSTFVGPDDDWSCSAGDPAGTVCQHPVGDLGAGDSGSVDFTVRVDDELPEGQTQLDNTVTVADDGENGEDPTPDDNVDTDTTPVKLLDVTLVLPECDEDVPYLTYEVEITNVEGGSLTITWINPDGDDVVMADLPLSGKVLWPGAITDEDGNPLDWPGWTEQADGTWVEGDEFDWVRPDVQVHFEVNPEATVTVAYPDTTPSCDANPPEPEVEPNVIPRAPKPPTVLGVQLPRTGADVDLVLFVAGLLLLAGGALTLSGSAAALRRQR